MEESNKEIIKKFILPIAIIVAISRVVIDFIPKILDASPVLYYSTFFICFIAEIIIIRYVIKKFKSINNNNITLRQAILLGVTLMVVIGALYGISSYVYDKFLDPNFQTNTMVKWGQMWGAEAEKAIIMQLEENPPTPKITGILFTILWFSFLGLIISAIMGSVFKTKKQETI